MGLGLFTLVFGAAIIFGFERVPSQVGASQRALPVRLSHMSSVSDNVTLDSSSELAPQSSSPSVEPIAVTGTTYSVAFSICGKKRKNCVVDGDTFWLDGEKIRLADIDTPEVHQPKCASEQRLGIQATSRFLFLLNQGPFQLQRQADREFDRYGRRLLMVSRDGSSLGDQLVKEGLAHRWLGKRVSWCD